MPRNINKIAFLMGSNYKGTSAELGACVSDCQNIKRAFTNRGFRFIEHVSETPLKWPIVKQSLETTLRSLRSGDIFFLYYSGHGLQIPDLNGDEIDGKDEAIYIDEKTIISDDQLSLLLQIPVSGVKIFLMFDCCHSGTIMDLPLSWENRLFKTTSRKFFRADMVCFSGCADNKVAYETSVGGFLTTSFIKTLQSWRSSGTRPWIDLFNKVSTELSKVSNKIQVCKLSINRQTVLSRVWI
jgi:hypothetical protein